MAYDPTVDRIVLFVEGHGCCPTTWLFDLRTGRWTRGNVETPTIEFVWGDLVNGGEIAFDASVGQVVIASGSERHGFDASVPGWKSQPLGLQRSFGVRLVYDAINERLVLLRDHAFLDGRWANPGDLVAWDVATEDWIELVPPLER